jgi:hypothetical protein
MATTTDPHPTRAPEHASPEEAITAEDIGFGKAILYGSLIGIVVFGVMCFVAIRLIDASISLAADLGISVWVGLWGGLFLGGTIAVGRWSKRRTGH